MTLTKPRPFGHYFILEKIAQGGMAEIFKGLTYDFSGIKKFIVIKRILPHIAANKDFINMLISEAKIAVHLSHGNIAQIFDLGKVGNDYFIVMEYVDGKTLSQIQKKSQKNGILVPVEYCAYFISELCSGLDYMHRRRDASGYDLKIVHRDISPQNIIVSYSGNVKIVDFGVAKAAIKLSESEAGMLKGKFAYMSPEQAHGEEIDYRSDIFSAGIVLWEQLVGQRLFKKKSNTETVLAVKQMAVVPPSQFRPDIPAELDHIVLKALSKEVGDRYGSAHDMSLELTKFLLKYYPDFKPTSITDYLAHLFEQDEEDLTSNLSQEKTLRDALSQMENTQHTGTYTEAKSTASEPGVSKFEETQIVAPEEIDFHSIFSEISWDEESIAGPQPSSEEASPQKASTPEPAHEEELSETRVLPLETGKKARRASSKVVWMAASLALLILLLLGMGWMILHFHHSV